MKRTLFAALLLAAVPALAANVRLVATDDGATLRFARAASTTVRVALHFDPDKPAAMQLTLRSLENGDTATTEIDAAGVPKLRTLLLPPGWYELKAAMPHHRTTTRNIHALGDAIALGEVPLRAAPVISGVVKKSAARIVSSEGDAVQTGADGRFALEVTGKWPKELHVRAPGFGTKIISLPAAEASVALPAVELAPAGSVRVVVERGAFDAPLELSLGIREEGLPAHWIAQQRIERGNTATFADLDAGTYTVLVAGPQPLERVAQGVNVGAGDVRQVKVPLHFVLAHGRITKGGKPLGGVSVRFENADHRWTSTVDTSATGEISTPLWQTGAFALSIRGGASHAPIVRNINLDERAFADFAIDVPDRRVFGRVVDEDGVPVANALVALRTQTKTFAPTVRMRTGEDGTFAFDGVYEGTQKLTIVPERYLYPDPRKFELAEGDRAHEEVFEVKRGSEREVRVVARDGSPLAGAVVVVASGDHVRAAVGTDERGRARIAAPASGQSVLFVFPREGSFVTRRLGSDEASVRVDVPPPGASLHIATLTTDGAAVPNVDLLVRFNGEIVPPDVLDQLARLQGISFETNESGIAHLQNLPLGTYEFWPYRSENEAESLLASASGFAAPIVVNAVTGENKVTVRFRRK